jgi:hypothetical protein
MATVLEGVYYRRTAFCCAFFVGKKRNEKDFHKEMFPAYGLKVFVA